jgi:hypothetical protein
MSYLDFYNRYSEAGRLPSVGLCGSFFLHSMDQSVLEDFVDHYSMVGTCWGYDAEYQSNHFPFYSYSKQNDVRFKFTSLRQNIVLFMAAMNNEL